MEKNDGKPASTAAGAKKKRKRNKEKTKEKEERRGREERRTCRETSRTSNGKDMDDTPIAEREEARGTTRLDLEADGNTKSGRKARNDDND